MFQMYVRSLVLAITGMVLLTMTAPALADTITVCLDGSCDFTDPAAATESAMTGDTIEIAAGTYLLENSVGFGANGPIAEVTIRGAVDSDGQPATVLDGQGALIPLATVYADQVRFENLVITNGYGEYGGGSRFIASQDVVVKNCHFVNNHADWDGGGVRLSLQTTLTLVDCLVSGNTADHPQWSGQSRGAGVLISDATLTLERTRVCGNYESLNPGNQVHGGPPALFGSCITEECDSCETTHPADLNFDSNVDVVDLLLLLDAWGGSETGDIDGNGMVEVGDVLALLAAWK
ncbi:MAG: hypothetical protein CMJ29_11685 [Phycisphaerae bacterium]|nr:hypothetical protein [Phycisphaerae bacterium]